MNKRLLGNFVKEITEKLKNVNAALSILMFITLFLSWFAEWEITQWNAHQSAFHVAKDYGIIWIIIICTIGLLVLSFLNVGSKAEICGGLSIVILIVLLISRFTMVGSGKFKGTAIGWKLMLTLCALQIVFSFIFGKNIQRNSQFKNIPINENEIKNFVKESSVRLGDAFQEVGTTVCSNCGNKILRGKNFCPKCGNPIVKEEIVNKELHCPQCGKIVKGNNSFCSGCGTKLEIIPPQRVCSNCGTELAETASFCPKCGTKRL